MADKRWQTNLILLSGFPLNTTVHMPILVWQGTGLTLTDDSYTQHLSQQDLMSSVCISNNSVFSSHHLPKCAVHTHTGYLLVQSATYVTRAVPFPGLVSFSLLLRMYAHVELRINDPSRRGFANCCTRRRLHFTSLVSTIADKEQADQNLTQHFSAWQRHHDIICIHRTYFVHCRILMVLLGNSKLDPLLLCLVSLSEKIPS